MDIYDDDQYEEAWAEEELNRPKRWQPITDDDWKVIIADFKRKNDAEIRRENKRQWDGGILVDINQFYQEYVEGAVNHMVRRLSKLMFEYRIQIAELIARSHAI